MSSRDSETVSTQRRLDFVAVVRRHFAFLRGLGFSEAEASETIVRLEKPPIEVVIYHGRQSFELGFEVIKDGNRYPMSQLIGVSDLPTAESYRNPTATTAADLERGLSRLAVLAQDYSIPALHGDPTVFASLDRLRQMWSESMSLDMLAKQIRPQASEAFRKKHYRVAAELYEQIRSRLTDSEKKKLLFAKKHSVEE